MSAYTGKPSTFKTDVYMIDVHGLTMFINI